MSGLDVPIESHDQRTQICYGSKAEVQRFEEYVYGQSPRFAGVSQVTDGDVTNTLTQCCSHR